MVLRSSFLPLYFFLAFGICNSSANHIAGGVMTYEFVKIDTDSTMATFDIYITVFRDENAENAADFDFSIDLGIYSKEDNQTYAFYNEVNVLLEGTQALQTFTEPCLYSNPIQYTKGTYTARIEIPLDGKDYLVAYQRCCRTDLINNIFESGETGMAFSVEILFESIIALNNSPSTFNYPPLAICVGEAFDFDVSWLDPDGNNLVYSFCQPSQAGGPVWNGNSSCESPIPEPSECLPPFNTVVYNSDYDVINPFGSMSDVKLDAVTGKITGEVEVTGIYQVGICVEEYRNGVKIGEVQLDYQFNVTDCIPIESSAIVTYYQDLDNDDFGNAEVSIDTCALPIGYVINNQDCDDTNENINPDAVEINGNNIDENCDGSLSANKNILTKQLIITPNSAYTYLELNGEDFQGNYTVLDINGLPVQQGKIDNKLFVDRLESGLYIISIFDEEGNIFGTAKFMKF